ncbi:MAG: BLUF domain-containing protein [Hyphomicrobiaceae bacterium]|nr:BLUF domain-containing protein [Hyphomicrobiaceae bacterium]
MYLFRLTYYSRNVIKSLDSSVGKEIKAILDASSRNNPPAGITGALIFNDQYFAQVLEGDRKSVTSTFTRIARDPRHSDIVILHARPIDMRAHDGWAMAYCGHSEIVDPLYLKYGTAIGFNPAKMTAENLEAFIGDLVKTEARVASSSPLEPAGPRIPAYTRV